MKITPILIVDDIEPSLDFWVMKLGFEKTVEVPEGAKLGFVILQKEGTEVMLQSRASVRKDAGSAVADEILAAGSHLYIEVESFSDALERVKGADVLVPERTTFYGMREIWVREPGGNVVGFAARTPQ
ncbi:MAG: VOC family protein [Bryobacteraceae bacterium]|jgi:catechol 2,3-dioxygenase-like lactoylglutathione lyase family enzyme